MLDTVALLDDAMGWSMDRRDVQLFRGQLGTMVEDTDAHHVLVEFVAEDGATYALASVPRSNPLRFHWGRAVPALAQERLRQGANERLCAALNRFHSEHGSFAAEYSTL